MNMGDAMKAMGAWNTFKSNHPKFAAFLQAVARKGIQEGSIIEISITAPDGEKLESSLRVQASDLELINSLRGLSK